MRLKCKDCGTVYAAAGKDHTCKPVKPVVAVTIPELLAIDFQKFDKKTWQREYMREWRKRDKSRKAAKCPPDK